MSAIAGYINTLYNPFYEIKHRQENSPSVDWYEYLGDCFTFISRQLCVSTKIYENVLVRWIPFEESGKFGIIIQIVKKVAKFVFLILSIPLLTIGTLLYRHSASRCTVRLNTPQDLPSISIQQLHFHHIFGKLTKQEFKALCHLLRQNRGELLINTQATLSQQTTAIFSFTVLAHRTGIFYLFRKTNEGALEIKSISLPLIYRKYVASCPEFSIPVLYTHAMETSTYSTIPDAPPLIFLNINSRKSSYPESMINTLPPLYIALLRRSESQSHIEYDFPEAVLKMTHAQELRRILKSEHAQGKRKNSILIRLSFPKDQKLERPSWQLIVGNDIYQGNVIYRPTPTTTGDPFQELCKGTLPILDLFDYIFFHFQDVEPLKVSISHDKPKHNISWVPISNTTPKIHTGDIQALLKYMNKHSITQINQENYVMISDQNSSSTRYLKFHWAMKVSRTGQLFFFKENQVKPCVRLIQLPEEFDYLYNRFPPAENRWNCTPTAPTKRDPPFIFVGHQTTN